MELYTPLPLPGESGSISDTAVPGGAFGGFVVHATGDAAAIVRFWDNADAASGTILGVADLAASGLGSWATVELEKPLMIFKGIYFEIVSGAVEGSVLLA